MGSGASVLIAVPLFFLLALAAIFCALVGSKTSARTGWLFAAILIGLPLALFIAFLIP
ncbi:hypothetical protein [Streptomyces sp. TRM75563]|uniref:hypothetical protein n=1 Tax=Streptomyces sp. TRM75563 TaxID=2817418 RepID=UPI001F5FFE80|nr:hypothetical protein [Streptomyces sp. TRM75563]MCI4045856.1 hypothetical protein [Streptomyces sp. TRM75563]